jgi:ribonuclease BN (tRNA processing enzyme)
VAPPDSDSVRAVRLEVLGKSPAWTDAGGACSGYLVREGATTLLLDCGNGVFGKLRARCDPFAVDAVLLTHLHADHVVDVLPFAYALRYAPRDPLGSGRARPSLYVPPGAHARLRSMVGWWGPEDLLDAAFDVHEYDPAGELAVGDLALRFCAVPHYVPTWAVELRATSSAAARLVYGADCAPNDALVDFARDADLLLVEATLTEPETDGERGHLTAAEAGAIAARAGAGQVVVTHYSDLLDAGRVREDAARALGREPELAVEGAAYEV